MRVINKEISVRFFASAMMNYQIVKGALCHGLWILTPIPELLNGRKVICHSVALSDVHNAGSEIKNKPFNLYYAFRSQDDVDIHTVSPYLFRANITNTLEYEDVSFLNDGRKKVRVTFNMLH